MVDTVVELLTAHPHLPVVCDPVLRAGGGGRLGKDEVGYAMRERLLPLSLIATPNLPEARNPRRTARRHRGRVRRKTPAVLSKHLLITGGHGDETEIHNRLDSRDGHRTLSPVSACRAVITVPAAPCGQRPRRPSRPG